MQTGWVKEDIVSMEVYRSATKGRQYSTKRHKDNNNENGYGLLY